MSHRLPSDPEDGDCVFILWANMSLEWSKWTPPRPAPTSNVQYNHTITGYIVRTLDIVLILCSLTDTLTGNGVAIACCIAACSDGTQWHRSTCSYSALKCFESCKTLPDFPSSRRGRGQNVSFGGGTYPLTRPCVTGTNTFRPTRMTGTNVNEVVDMTHAMFQNLIYIQYGGLMPHKQQWGFLGTEQCLTRLLGHRQRREGPHGW